MPHVNIELLELKMHGWYTDPSLCYVVSKFVQNVKEKKSWHAFMREYLHMYSTQQILLCCMFGSPGQFALEESRTQPIRSCLQFCLKGEKREKLITIHGSTSIL